MKLFTYIKTYVVLFWLLLCPLSVLADVFTEPQSLQSPNVATLGAFHEPEVALYTGTPSLSIPLLELNLQNYVLPIELQYNGTSIQVDQCPSWVGLGWNLSAGGVVTRRVNDVPDEITYDAVHFVGDAYPDAGFYHRYVALATDNWSNFGLNTAGTINIPYYYYDTEPDEFFFTFPGYSGHFYINHLGNLEVQCAKPVSVSLIGRTLEPPFLVKGNGWSEMKKQPDTFNGFIITIEDGTQFVFGNDTCAIDFSAPFFDYQQTMVADAWHLTKIIAPNKQQISFKYSRQKFTNQMYISDAMVSNSFTYSWFGFNLSSGSNSSSLDVSGKLLSPVYLQEINTPILKISFEKSETHDLQYEDNIYNRRLNVTMSGRARMMLPYLTDFTMVNNYEDYLTVIHSQMARYQLNRIKIQTVNNSASRFINFSYNQNATTRLSLSSVNFQDNSSYSFMYRSVAALPAYLSQQTDHWGYYNATSSANWSFSSANYYNLRQPSSYPYNVQYGMLTDVIYPTGAKSHFEYELNDYRKQVAEVRWRPLISHSSNKQGGGARIKSISFYDHYDDLAPTSKREFFYRKGYIYNHNSSESSGILGTSFKYNYHQTFSWKDDRNRTYSYNAILFTAGNVLPYCGSDNSVCYSEVTEKISSGGYKVYKYTNYSDFLDEAPINMLDTADALFVPCTSMRHMRGLLMSVEDYNASGALVHKTSYSYTPNKDVSKYARAVYWVGLNTYSNILLSIGATYKYYTHTMLPDTVIDYKVSGTTVYDKLMTVNRYNLNTQTLNQVHMITDDSHLSVEYIYPYDLRGGYARILADTMFLAHTFLPWEIITRKDGKVIGANFYNYSKLASGVFVNDAVYSLASAEPLTNFRHVNFMKMRDARYNSLSDASYVYSADGFISEVTEKGITTSYIWGYNHSYIVAKIVGGSLSDLPAQERTQYMAYATRFVNETEVASLRNNLLSSFPNALVSVYCYNPLWGMTREIMPNGRSQYYAYDTMGRLNEIYIMNGTAKSVLKKYYYHYHE